MDYACPEMFRNTRLIATDIETTGLSIQANNIIEIGVVEVVNGEIKTKYSKMFGGGRSPVYLVRQVHGIKDGIRAGKQTFADCARNIADWFRGAILITHNGAKFDIPFIKGKMEEVGVNLDIAAHYDTYLICKNLKRDKLDFKGNPVRDEKGKVIQEPVYERHSLEYMCGQFGIPYDENNHRGLTDCLCTLQLFYALCQKHGDKAVG